MKKSMGFFGLLLLCSCRENDDIVSNVPATGSIEAVISVTHLTPATDILVTRRVVHTNEKSILTFVTTDTIPSLGKAVEKNEDGDTTKVPIEKNYEIFITVK